MCDTLCVRAPGRMLFAKNSDRPVGEAQVVEAYAPRPAGGRLKTQYLEIDDAGAAAVLGSRPDWLWGLEHGVNAHGVAVGNEKVWTIDDPYDVPPALIGMDLVRLGLERGTSAGAALDAITALLDEHGQGGVGDASANEPYWSSFLVADAHDAWILETSGRTWAARPVDNGAAISNRITLGTDWTRASADVAPGADFDAWRNPDSPTGHADQRLAVTRAACASVATAAPAVTPRDLAAVMRHHGTRPWGAPGAGGDPEPPPELALPDGTGVTVCMHIRGYQVTAASMIVELPTDPDEPRRAWTAVGSPCVSVYVPLLVPAPVPVALSDAGTWKRIDALRERVETDPAALTAARERLSPVEAEAWE
ncbi:MAG TPA: hypothetical protein VM618_08255, partial [Acidimicrobiia bacterium]|nr:hypothetical protein [Acidimicrobiia bacterium]